MLNKYTKSYMKEAKEKCSKSEQLKNFPYSKFYFSVLNRNKSTLLNINYKSE